MLVLSRNVGGEIFIDGKRIQIKILSVCGNQVRLGITADKSVSIHRSEVFERIHSNEETIKNGRKNGREDKTTESYNKSFEGEFTFKRRRFEDY